MHITKIAALLSALFLAGCGDDTKIPPTAPIGQISGNAVDALIINGTVRAYAWENGEKGEEITLTPVTTDENGAFKIEVQTNRDMPIIVAVRGGYYIEEASGKTVSLNPDQSLTVVHNYKHGENLQLMATAWTHLAVAKATALIKKGMDTASAVDAANESFSEWLDVNITTTYPVDITSDHVDATGFYDGVKYGLASAALSQWTYDFANQAGIDPHNSFPSIAVNNILYADMLDGSLDGVVDGAKIKVGNATLSADLIRQQLGAGMLRIVQRNEVNSVGIALDDSLPYAQRIASATLNFFGDDSPIPIDSTPPNLIDTELPKVANKVTTFSVNAYDYIGVNRVELLIDGVLQSSFDGNTGGLSFDSTQFNDGELTITIRLVDILDNATDIEHTIIVANHTIAIDYTSRKLLADTDHVVTGNVYNAHPPFTIDVGGVTAKVVDESFSAANVNLSEGVNILPVAVSDSADRKYNAEHTISIDMTPPEVKLQGTKIVRTWRPDGTVTNSEFPSNSQQVVYLGYDTVRLGLTPLDFDSLDARLITYIQVLAEDVGEVFSTPSELTARYTATVNGNITAENQSVPRNEDGKWVLPFTQDFFPTLFTWTESDLVEVTFTVSDKLGNETQVSHTLAFYVDLPTVEQWTMFPSSVINGGYYHTPTLGATVAQCQTQEIADCGMRFTLSFLPLAVSIQEGYYRDIDGKHWPINEETSSFVTLVDFYEIDKQIYTTPLASGYKGLFDRFAKIGATPKASYNKARERMILLYEFDPLATPVGDLCEGCELTDEQKHALLLGGYSLFASQNGFTPLELAETLSLDFAADGILNGLGADGEQLYINDYQVTHETYRAELYRAVNEYHSSIGKPLGNTTVGVWAQAMSLRTNENFNDNDIPEGMDISDPFADAIKHFGEWVKGIITFDINSTDDIGIARTTLTVSGRNQGTVENRTHVSYEVDTNEYDDGKHSVNIELVDDVENLHLVEGDIFIDNTEPELGIAALANQWVTQVIQFELPISEISPYVHEVYKHDVKLGESETPVVTIDTTALSEGNNTLTSKVTDSVELSSETTTLIKVDNTAPVIAASNQADNWFKESFAYRTPVTDVSPTEIAVSVGATQIAKSTDVDTVTINTKSFSDGVQAVTTVAVDSVGNTTERSEQLGFDNTAPEILPPLNINDWFSGQIVYNATINDASPVTNVVTLNESPLITLESGSTPIDTTTLSDGQYTLTMKATDSVGLSTSKSFTLKVDNYAPIIGDSPLANTWQKGSFSFYAPITESNAYTNEVSRNGIRYQSLSSKDQLSVTTTDLDEGDNTITFDVTDASGKAASKSFNIKVDNTAPIIYEATLNPSQWYSGMVDFQPTITEISPYKNIVTLNNTLVGEFSDNTVTFDTTRFDDGSYELAYNVTDAVKLTTKKTFAFNLDNNAPTIPDWSGSGQWHKGTIALNFTLSDFNASKLNTDLLLDNISQGSYAGSISKSLNTTTLTNGTHNLKITTVDPAGWSAEKAWTFYVDNDTPVIPNWSGSGKWHKGNVALDLNITDYNATNLVTSLLLDDSSIGTYANRVTKTLTTASYSNGAHTLKVTTADPASNSASKSWTFYVDNDTPVIPNWSGAGSWHKGTITFKADISDYNASSLSTVLYLDGVSQGTYSNSISKSVNTTTLSGGSHVFKVTTSDPAGNASEKSFTFYVDNTVPALTLDKSDYNISDTSTVTIGGTVSDSESGIASVKVNGASATVSSGRWSYTSNAITVGSHSLTVIATNGAGMTSSGNITVVRDDTPKEVMAGTVACNGSSGSFPSSASMSCSYSGIGSSFSLPLTLGFSNCGGSGTCSVSWSGTGVTQSGNNATVTQTVAASSSTSGTATATMTDSSNGHTVTFKVNWTITNSGACVPNATSSQMTYCTETNYKTCETGEQRRTCSVTGTWGSWTTISYPSCMLGIQECR